MSIRILIADGHETVLDGLAAVIDSQSDFETVGRARESCEVEDSAFSLVPDVVVTDISLPGIGGIETVRRITSERPEIKIVCLSMHRERQYTAAALEAGAVGYLLKDRISEQLIEAIRCVEDGGVYLGPEIRLGLVPTGGPDG